MLVYFQNTACIYIYIHSKETPRIYIVMDGRSQKLRLLQQYLSGNNKIKTSNLSVAIRIQVLKNRQIFRKMEINGDKWKSVELHANGKMKRTEVSENIYSTKDFKIWEKIYWDNSRTTMLDQI